MDDKFHQEAAAISPRQKMALFFINILVWMLFLVFRNQILRVFELLPTFDQIEHPKAIELLSLIFVPSIIYAWKRCIPARIAVTSYYLSVLSLMTGLDEGDSNFQIFLATLFVLTTLIFYLWGAGNGYESKERDCDDLDNRPVCEKDWLNFGCLFLAILALVSILHYFIDCGIADVKIIMLVLFALSSVNAIHDKYRHPLSD
jgi:hypothetical protein